MLIEIHMIQNHSPSNLNRDDLGAPKTCIFGGVTRARISSQCLKRSIRNPGNPDEAHNREPGLFATAMAGHTGLRTKFFPWLVSQVLEDTDVKSRFLEGGTVKDDYENTKKAIVAACKVIARKEETSTAKDKKKTQVDERPQTPQLIFLGPGHARMFVEVLVNTQRNNKAHYTHFLDPATIFEALLEQELAATTLLSDEQRERVLNGGWRIKNTPQRMDELKQILEGPTDDKSDEQQARFIAQALDTLASQDAKAFESITSSRGRRGEPKLETKREKPPKYKEFQESLAAIHSGDAVDIALFGRMTTSDAFQDVEAAMQVAHAISTHAIVNEVDYFTAVDDLGKTGGGAGHVDEAMFNSACFYKYFCLDWDQLVHNLAPEPKKPEDKKNDGLEKWKTAHQKWNDELKPQAERLAACTLGHFIRAAALTTPSGKQNSFASNCEPCGILVEIKKNGKISTNYANAFAEPAERIDKPPDDAPDCVSLLGRSIAQLGDHVYSVRKAYGIDSTVLWHALPLYRFPLQGWEREKDGRRKKDAKGKALLPPVTFADECREALGGEDDKPEGLVEAVVNALNLGFQWSEIKDAGKARNRES